MLASLTAAACGDNYGAPDAGGGGSGHDARNVDARVADARDLDAPNLTTPTVMSTTPGTGATDVALNTNVKITFSEPMDRSTLNGTNFTLTVGNPAVPVTGTIVTTNTTLVFWPAAVLTSGVTYTASISTGARSAAHVPLAAAHTWTFTTGTTVAPGMPVDLGTAGNYVILAKSGITTVPASVITGDIAVSPIAAVAIIGFDLMADATNVFARSGQVTGKVFAANYADPTPANLTTAVSDMETAFVDAAGRAPDVINMGAGTIGTVTLPPGVYKWGTGLSIPTSIMLSGSATGVWIFQISGTLNVANGVNITLGGNALAKNVFWQVTGQVDIGTSAHVEGVFLGQTAIILDTGASINGRLLAQTKVTVRVATVTQPAP